MIPFITPQEFFGDDYAVVLDLMASHSPFPRGHSEAYGKEAKMRAAKIHLDETVFFAQAAYHDLEPFETVELCAGSGIPSLTLNKLFSVNTVCVDTDANKMQTGAEIAALCGISPHQEKSDIFLYLRRNAKALHGKTLLATAAYCRNKKMGRPKGTGEKDIVTFAQSHGINLALLPFRSGHTITTGMSNEQTRVDEYERLLTAAGFFTRRHSTEVLFRGLGAPDWFFLDILTAKSVQ